MVIFFLLFGSKTILTYLNNLQKINEINENCTVIKFDILKKMQVFLLRGILPTHFFMVPVECRLGQFDCRSGRFIEGNVFFILQPYFLEYFHTPEYTNSGVIRIARFDFRGRKRQGRLSLLSLFTTIRNSLLEAQIMYRVSSFRELAYLVSLLFKNVARYIMRATYDTQKMIHDRFNIRDCLSNIAKKP